MEQSRAGNGLSVETQAGMGLRRLMVLAVFSTGIAGMAGANLQAVLAPSQALAGHSLLQPQLNQGCKCPVLGAMNWSRG